MVLLELTSQCPARFSLGRASDHLCIRCTNEATAEKFAKHMAVLVEVSRKQGRRMTQSKRDSLGTLLDFLNSPPASLPRPPPSSPPPAARLR